MRLLPVTLLPLTDRNHDTGIITAQTQPQLHNRKMFQHNTGTLLKLKTPTEQLTKNKPLSLRKPYTWQNDRVGKRRKE